MGRAAGRRGMADGLLEAVRGLRLADPELGPKPLLAKLREQQPDLGAGNKEVREALTALKAERKATEAAAAAPPAATPRPAAEASSAADAPPAAAPTWTTVSCRWRPLATRKSSSISKSRSSSSSPSSVMAVVPMERREMSVICELASSSPSMDSLRKCAWNETRSSGGPAAPLTPTSGSSLVITCASGDAMSARLNETAPMVLPACTSARRQQPRSRFRDGGSAAHAAARHGTLAIRPAIPCASSPP